MRVIAKFLPSLNDSPKAFDTCYDFARLDLSDLTRVVIEQIMVYRFLRRIADCPTVDSLKMNIDAHLGLLRNRVATGSDYQDDIIAKAIDMIPTLLDGNPVDMNENAHVLESLYNLTSKASMEGAYKQKEYLPSMPNEFMDQWMQLFMGYINPSKYKELRSMLDFIWVPELLTTQEYNPNIHSSENTEFIQIIMMRPINTNGRLLSYGFTDDFEYNIFDYIGSFDLSDKTPEDVIAIIANFAFDTNMYMGITSFLKNKLTGVSGDSSRDDMLIMRFTALLKAMIDDGRLSKSENETFRYILENNTEIQNVPHLSKRTYDRYAYLGYFDLMVDKKALGLEALDEPEGEENTDNDEPDDDQGVTTSDTEDPADPAAGDEGTDEGSDFINQESDKDQTQEDQNKIRLDPNYILLELIGTKTTGANDFIIRDMVDRKLSYLIKNPPLNMRSTDIQLLKALKEKWLFLVTTRTLKDFLARFANKLL